MDVSRQPVQPYEEVVRKAGETTETKIASPALFARIQRHYYTLKMNFI